MIYIHTREKEILLSIDQTDVMNYVFFHKLSAAFDSDEVGNELVEFDGNGYIDYLEDGNRLLYSRLSLISLCSSYGIDPIDVMEGKIDYYVYFKMCDGLVENLGSRLYRAEKNLTEEMMRSNTLQDKINRIGRCFVKYVGSNRRDVIDEMRREIFGMCNVDSRRRKNVER